MRSLQELQAVAEKAGYPGDAAVVIMLLLETADQRRDSGGSRPSGVMQMSARELCDGLLRSETSESWNTMRELGLLTSEDVGRVVYALVEEGLISALPGESEQDFVGLFDLRQSNLRRTGWHVVKKSSTPP